MKIGLPPSSVALSTVLVLFCSTFEGIGLWAVCDPRLRKSV